MRLKGLVLFILLFLCFALGQNKPSIALLELDASGISKTDAAVLADRLQSELINTQKFVVMERAKVTEILNEQGFQTSGCTSTDCAVEVGKLIGVEQMVAGNIGKIGGIYTINVRLISVQTSEVLRTAIVDRRCSIEVVLTECMREAAQQLAGERKPSQQQMTLQDKPVESPKQEPSDYQPTAKRKSASPEDRSLIIGIGWNNGNYTLPENLFLDNEAITAKVNSYMHFLFAFNISHNLRANFSYSTGKVADSYYSYDYEGTIKTYYPRLLLFPWDWLYLSYGYAFTSLNIDISASESSNDLLESTTERESRSAFAVGFDFQLLKRFHLIYEYNVLKHNNHSAITIAFAF
jgi:TolB-like protein